MENTFNTDKICLKNIVVNKNSIKNLFLILDKDFPRFSRIPFFMIRSALKKEVLKAVYLTDGINKYGYAVYQYCNDLKMIHIMYLAINPEFRSLGLGSILIRELNKISNSRIILDVENPYAANLMDKEKDIRLRRVDFYKRNGFEIYPHFKFDNFGYKMNVMSNIELPRQNWLKFYRKLYGNVVSKVIAFFVIKPYK